MKVRHQQGDAALRTVECRSKPAGVPALAGDRDGNQPAARPSHDTQDAVVGGGFHHGGAGPQMGHEQRHGGPGAAGDEDLLGPGGQALPGEAVGDLHAEFWQARTGSAIAEQHVRRAGQRTLGSSGVSIHGRGGHRQPEVQQAINVVDLQRGVPDAQ